MSARIMVAVVGAKIGHFVPSFDSFGRPGRRLGWPARALSFETQLRSQWGLFHTVAYSVVSRWAHNLILSEPCVELKRPDVTCDALVENYTAYSTAFV